MSLARYRAGTCLPYQPSMLGYHCATHGCIYERYEWPIGHCREARGEDDYRRFLERCVTSDGRGALVALAIVVAISFAVAVFAYVRHLSSSADDFRPQILS